jgi:hypothetical protein
MKISTGVTPAIDAIQDVKIKILIVGISLIGATVAILIYLDQKKHNKVQQNIFELDKEIKMLQLKNLKNGQSSGM